MAKTVGQAAEDVAEHAFHAGYLMAVANIVHLHDEPTIAVDVLRELGATKEILSGMEFTDFDLKVLRILFDDMERSK